VELAGKVAIITGGASGIGRASSLRFGTERATVIVVDVDLNGALAVATAIRQAGGQALGLRCDVTNEAEVKALVEHVSSSFGRIDLFWSNAGISVPGGVETPNEQWQRAWEVNVMSHVYAVRAVLPDMLARRSGYLIHTASAAGLLTHLGALPYAVSKHAVVALAEWLSITYGAAGIGVSCLCPKVVRTGMMKQALEHSKAAAQIASAYGVVLEPEQIADMVVQALKEERFLILPHADVLPDFQQKAANYGDWLASMRHLREQTNAFS